MKSNYKRLAPYIRQVDERNSEDVRYDLLGVSVEKCFIKSIANTVGTDWSGYKKIRRGQFCYIPDTSRRGDKIGIALQSDYDIALVSQAYTVFEIIDTNELLPEYLNLWFKRPEFDRYARFHSHGSVREIFDWDEMCNVELPVPPIAEQQKIVNAYNVVEKRIALKKKINDNLEATLTTKFNELLKCNSSGETVCLQEIISFENGKARPQAVGDIPVYGGNGIMSYTNQSNARNIVLIGRVGAYCGSVYLEEQDCWVSDNAIFAKSKIVKEEYYDYFLLKGLNLFNLHVGTGQQLLTQTILNKIEVPKCTCNSIEQFNITARSVFITIIANRNEVEKLSKLRLLLLTQLSR